MESTPASRLPEIAIVAIDDASLAALGNWPWPLQLHADLIDHLSGAGAKTIVFTPLLPAPPQVHRASAPIQRMQDLLAPEREGSLLLQQIAQLAAEAKAALDGETRLATSIRRAGNVLLAAHDTPPGAVPADPLPLFAQRSALPAAAGESAIPALEAGARFPWPAFGTVAAGTGHLSVLVDSDGVVRRVPLLVRHGEVVLPSLALLAARHSLWLGSGEVGFQLSPPAIRLGGLRIAIDDRGVVRPRFAKGSADVAPFPTISFATVLRGGAAPDNLRGKIVLVGPTSASIMQAHTGPGGQALYPVDLLAHTLSTIRQGQTVLQPTWAISISAAAALAAVAWVALALPRLPVGAGWTAGTCLLLLLVMAAWALPRHAGLWVPLASPMVALLAGTLCFAALRRAGGIELRATETPQAQADRMMGLALLGRGELEQAFDRLRKLPPSDALMGDLYHLARDFERKRNFGQAKAAYKCILKHQREFKDVKARYQRMRALVQAGGPALSVGQKAESSAAAPRPPREESVPISTLGRYQIEKEIGKGAMGVVYQGRDPAIGRSVALKTLALSSEFDGEALADARARFFREAETAGRLQHPCIVTIFDAGEERDLAYIAMEFLRGADLASACRAGQLLPVSTILSIAARVADALDYAHAHQVVHRDVKPANIMFDAATDTVKVMDFGIARITDSSKTRTGVVLGTPSFMSPEQLAGKGVDGRTDIYSLGVTLFQLLTGALPFRADSMTDLMRKIATAPAPNVRQLRPELSPAVAHIVTTALQKRPEARFQTGQKMAAALRQAVDEAGQMEPRESEAVVYDALRDAQAQERVDIRTTVMGPSAGRGTASTPDSSAR